MRSLRPCRLSRLLLGLALLLLSGVFATPAAAQTAALSGTVIDDSETDIRTGGSTIILTLTGDTWVAAGAAFDAQRQNIIDGLDSAQAEAAGWDAVVKAGLAVTDVVRTSATVVTVTLPAFGAYDLTTRETITATIPATAVVGGSAIVAQATAAGAMRTFAGANLAFS